ncbi:protein GDAP2 homolog [Ornithodoros turicata]|uniref:protein GDAP2 homolog n=1 Tax=Ornithodoros turicata TaxID=34597 RepID=UPI0031399CDB
MDPLGAVPDVVDLGRFKRWSEIAPRDLKLDAAQQTPENVHETTPFPINEGINKKIALWCGDISCISAHAIVNSTNESLAEKYPSSARILARGGPQLKHDLFTEVRTCRTGEAKLTKGYSLPARFVIHTVGPKYNQKFHTAAETALHSSYWRVLQVMRENQLTTLGLCAIHSTRRGYPAAAGAHIALRTVRRFLELHGESMECIAFVVEDIEVGTYESLLPLYFPRIPQEEEAACRLLPKDIGGACGEPLIPERQIRIVDKPLHDVDDDESVDINLDSSVCVGKTAFARMHGDVDHRRATLGDNLTREVHRTQRYERLLRRAKQEDLSSIESLHCFYLGGKDRRGRPFFVFVGQRFRPHEVDLEKALLYAIDTMDGVVSEDYSVVYLHSLTTGEHHVPISFLRDVYESMELRYRKRLSAVYMLHPTWWTKVVTWWFTTFTAAEIRHKVHPIRGVEDLYCIIAPDQIELPRFVLDYDYLVNGVRYCDVPITQSSRRQ